MCSVVLLPAWGLRICAMCCWEPAEDACQSVALSLSLAAIALATAQQPKGYVYQLWVVGYLERSSGAIRWDGLGSACYGQCSCCDIMFP